MKKHKLIFLFMIVATIISCEKSNFGLDEKNDPQALSEEQGELGAYFFGIQLQYSKLFEEYHEMTREVVRHTTMTGSRLYENAYLSTSFDTGWRIAYSDILVNAETIIALSSENNQTKVAGATKIVKVMTYLMLTDMFGDIPYENAIKGEGDFNPTVTSSADIYADLITQLEAAIVDLSNDDSVSINASNDLFYDGSSTNWIKAANSLLIRIYVTQRKAVSGTSSQINQIVSSGNYIATAEDDLQFKYSSSTSPDSRHFLYANNYVTGASDYFGNFFMDLLLNDKTNRDPRLRYILRRQQIVNTTEVSEKDCLSSVRPVHYGSDDPFCELVDGYWGRDHGDDAGTPPDGRARTTWGVYPAGGDFDADQGVAVTGTSGGKGAGISPIIMSSFIDFYLAEAAITMGTTGNAKDLLLSGISKSIDKIISFGDDIGVSISSNFTATEGNKTAYIAEVEARFDNASTDEEKIAIVAKEFYIASIGNGFEAYNLYRRTGFPVMQKSLSPDAGNFIRTFKYPSDLVNRNTNVKPKADQNVKVFWDTGLDNLN